MEGRFKTHEVDDNVERSHKEVDPYENEVYDKDEMEKAKKYLVCFVV